MAVDAIADTLRLFARPGLQNPTGNPGRRKPRRRGGGRSAAGAEGPHDFAHRRVRAACCLSCRSRQFCSTRPSSFFFIAAGFARHARRAFRPFPLVAGLCADRRRLSRSSRSCSSSRIRWTELSMPPQMHLRFGNFVYFYMLLVGARLRLQAAAGHLGRHRGRAGLDRRRPSGSCSCPTRSWPCRRSQRRNAKDARSDVAVPTYVDIDSRIRDIVVFLIIAALLAGVVTRSRQLVERQASLERERGNLARYFPPATVDRLAARIRRSRRCASRTLPFSSPIWSASRTGPSGTRRTR